MTRRRERNYLSASREETHNECKYVDNNVNTNTYEYSATPIVSAFSPLRCIPKQTHMSSIAVRHQVCHEGQENTQGAKFLAWALALAKSEKNEPEKTASKINVIRTKTVTTKTKTY